MTKMFEFRAFSTASRTEAFRRLIQCFHSFGGNVAGGLGVRDNVRKTMRKSALIWLEKS